MEDLLANLLFDIIFLERRLTSDFLLTEPAYPEEPLPPYDYYGWYHLFNIFIYIIMQK